MCQNPPFSPLMGSQPPRPMPKHKAEKKKQQLFASTPPPPPPPPSPSDPSDYAASLIKVAVAQICLTIGYTGAESFALRSLSDIAARHLQSVVLSASSASAAQGRTDCNILDLVQALEHARDPGGFTGAADVARPALRSSVLRDLMVFVASVDEIPFPKPLRSETKKQLQEGRTWRSFAEAGREAPLRHVPRWLPCFPGSEGEPARLEEKEVARGAEETAAEKDAPAKRRSLPAERRAVRFRIGKNRSKLRRK